DDVLVIDECGRARLDEEALGEVARCGREEFDRDATRELDVAREVDLAHATATELADQLVLPQAQAGIEPQAIDAIAWLVRVGHADRHPDLETAIECGAARRRGMRLARDTELRGRRARRRRR